MIRRGPLYMMIGALMITVMITFVKVARAHISAIEIIFWRCLIATPLAGLLACRVGLAIHNWRLLLVRIAFGFFAMLAFFTAAKGLAVADMSIIGQLQPILIALIAPIALGRGERPGPMIWLMLAIGLGASGMILAPDLAVGSYYGVLALCGTVLAAGAHVATRGLMRTDDARAVVFYFQFFVLLATVPIILIDTGQLPTIPAPDLLLCLLAIGVTATLGQVLMTLAYAQDRAPVVAAAKYTSLVWSVIADIVAFAIVPDWNVLIGGGLITVAGLWLVFASD